jgi:signal transduction histidine kinase
MKKSLFRRYAGVIMLLVGAALLAGGVAELVLNYRESRMHIDRVQRLQAQAAATRIEQYLKVGERLVGEMSALPWVSGQLNTRDRRDEYYRLMKLSPGISELRAIDANGKERLKVSRIDMDEFDSGRDYRNDATFRMALASGTGYSTTYFKHGSEPYLLMGVRDRVNGAAGAQSGWVTLVELNLRFIGDVVKQIHAGDKGQAYVIDRTNHLVAHPNASYVLRQSDLSKLPHIMALRGSAGQLTGSIDGVSLEGEKVLAAFSPVGVADWWIIVEQPLSAALGPVYSTILRTGILFMLGIVVALAASYWLARRLTEPVVTVQRGAARIGSGDLGTRIQVNTDDEIESLADEFNRMAARLEESYSGLEQKVKEKTAQLELANRHKSEFLANMSHELRTPLNAVIGFSDVLKEQYFGALNEKQLEYAKDINASGQHLLSLINDILDLSKIEAGKMELDAATFSLRGAAGNSLTLIRERALRQNLTVEAHFSDGLDEIVADERKVKQVLINLLSNAVKFSYPNGRVFLTANRVQSDIVVSVSDTGPGIAPADQAIIFEEFKQLNTMNTAKHEGTGLGLSLARRFVELHGGRIWVESQEGHGATFSFTIPQGPEAEAARALQ